MNEYLMVVVQTGCDARRDECRVAGHTNEEQRSSAPVCAAKMGYSFTEITLTLHAKTLGPLGGMNSQDFKINSSRPHSAWSASRATVTGKWGKSIAILTHSGPVAAKISAALNSGQKPVKHKLLFDENAALLSARIAAFLLEPKEPADRLANVANAVDMFNDIERAKGSSKMAGLQKWAEKIRPGRRESLAARQIIGGLPD